MERLIFKGHRFKKVIAISELVKKNIIEHYHVNEKDIEVIYNGVDLERFNPMNKDLYRSKIRKQYSISDNAIVPLFVGSGFERKGVEFLLKAVELVSKPLTVLIVGRGPEKKFKNLIKSQRVIFCGPQKEIHKYYAASDLFVFPTIYEPFGNVHLEALASGLPVITTRLRFLMGKPLCGDPSHLHFFSYDTLNNLLQKYFRKIEIIPFHGHIIGSNKFGIPVTRSTPLNLGKLFSRHFLWKAIKN